MKPFIQAILLIILPFCCGAQQNGRIPQLTVKNIRFQPAIPRDTTVFNQLSRDPLASGMRETEREILYWVNMLRKDPPRFYRWVIIPYLREHPAVKGSYTRSLKTALLQQQPLSLLRLSHGLTASAKELASDLSTHLAPLSHEETNGKTFAQRMKEAKVKICASENVFEGDASPLEMIVTLLIDVGDEETGHRKNLLDPGIHFTGISLLPYGYKEKIMIEDFSCE